GRSRGSRPGGGAGQGRMGAGAEAPAGAEVGAGVRYALPGGGMGAGRSAGRRVVAAGKYQSARVRVGDTGRSDSPWRRRTDFHGRRPEIVLWKGQLHCTTGRIYATGHL